MRIIRTASALLAATALTAAPALAQDGPQPAFPGQTDAPAPETASEFELQSLVAGIASPFGFAVMPDGDFLVTQRTGSLHIATPEGFISQPLDGVPAVRYGSSSGLHDIALAPDFAESRIVYLSYTAPPEGERGGSWPRSAFGRWNARPLEERIAEPMLIDTVARARLNEDATALTDLEVIATGASRRLVFAPDGSLYVTGAERYDMTPDQWDFDGGPGTLPREQRIRHSGRVVRVMPDGAIPEDNPYAGGGEGAPETFSFGHRDPQGASIHPETGELWMVEHGPMGGDELNVIRAGTDYGWPNITYGVQMSGQPVADGESAGDGYEQPVYFWVPSIAPSGAMFYDGEMFPDWQGDFFVAALAGMHLIRLKLDGERVVAEEKLLENREQRIRDLDTGADGSVYVLTDGGEIWRLAAE